ncbi:cytochrome P40 monooxygenase [Coniella lustricola]|uniref:Cytochrome P40 monooxygenase n=1 Tax=Coniella lustricola TaxID=2025994 RepID=A0A2T3A9A8_9PEZI|nr:cytochrome P40 monooxygenase [Coniella lustricola]
MAALTDSWSKKSMATGDHTFRMQALHKKHGDIVRTGPNTLSFATVNAYRDIYGHVGQDKKRFLKNAIYEREDPRITSVRDPAAHAEQRRALSHAFSARALRDQEDVVHQYVDALLRKLGELGEQGVQAVDMTEAYNWLTFDIIGDLAFGEPFNAVSQASSKWVQGIIDWSIYQSLAYMMKTKPLYRILLPLMWGSRLSTMRTIAEESEAMAKDKTRRRLETPPEDLPDRADFFSHLIKKQQVTERYMMGTSQTLIVAGSETTATALIAMTFWLLKTPHTLAKLQAEVRGTFSSLEEITGDATAAKCAYLHAVVEEGLRLSPPVATALPRDCPGTVIDGVYVPEGVVVGVDNYSMSRDPRWWKDPESFIPERWLQDKDDKTGKNVGRFAEEDKRASQPFSLGPRACLGINLAYVEMRIMLAKLVFAYDLELESTEIADWNRACKMYGLWKKPPCMVKLRPHITL